jgi:hypothetical protein
VKRTRWTKVDARIVECFRAWGESWRAAHPSFEIVADIKTGAGEVERVTSHQRLDTYTHHWRPPDPGDIVPARWDPVQRRLRLNLRRDPRYDKKLIRRLARSREGPSWPPTGVGGMGQSQGRSAMGRLRARRP